MGKTTKYIFKGEGKGITEVTVSKGGVNFWYPEEPRPIKQSVKHWRFVKQCLARENIRITRVKKHETEFEGLSQEPRMAI